jgi:histone acetyltransferase (RNA polymerase elongator complex component)
MKPILVVRKYTASQGTEYHLSIEAHKMNVEQTILYWLFMFRSWLYWFLTGCRIYWPGRLDTYVALFGFLRLRIDPDPGGDFVPELRGCGLIREVHVYGTSLGVGLQTQSQTHRSQHRGYGQLMIRVAEQICLEHGLKRTAVIAGIGVREYYKNKCGYRKGEYYMLKGA